MASTWHIVSALSVTHTHTPEIQRTEQLFIMVFKLPILKESTLLPPESTGIFIKKDFSFLKLSLLVIFKSKTMVF